MNSKTVSLVGAMFCFGAFLIFAVIFANSTVTQLGFSTTGEKEIANIMFMFGSAFLIAYGLAFLRDYYRT